MLIIKKNRRYKRQLLEAFDNDIDTYQISGTLNFLPNISEYEIYFCKIENNKIVDLEYECFNSKDNAIKKYIHLCNKYKK